MEIELITPKDNVKDDFATPYITTRTQTESVKSGTQIIDDTSKFVF